jgi:GNAT superfamily N-acetyltransferase
VCRAEPEELDEILALDLECVGGDWTPGEDAALFVVRDDAERVCAYASARPSVQYDRVVYLDRAGVAPVARGRGLQRRLIRARLAWARAQGATHAVTYTLPFNVVSSNNLIKTGFRMYDPKRPWAGRDGALYWIKSVAAP